MQVHAQAVRLADAYPDKARYAPADRVEIEVELSGSPAPGDLVSATLSDLSETRGKCGPIRLAAHAPAPLLLPCTVPTEDFRGYLVTVELRSADGRLLDQRETALDISSDWKRFPRYGYLAHYNASKGAKPAVWVAELNRFHIDGLQFYDFQYRHEKPLAGTIAAPASTWKDIAGREIDASVVRSFINEAHARNMMAMAYNASYSANDDAFSGSYPLPLAWATWPAADGARTPQTAKSFNLNIPGWSTSKLFYMNQNDAGWQKYLFGQMHELFEVYAFDGWHIDTFGAKSVYAFDGSPVDYIAGFETYINHASAALKKRVLFNAVNTFGQDRIAQSAADFVYSELWEDHETFASIPETAEQVHLANARRGFVIAAYLHRRERKDGPAPAAKDFNPASVLLTDATIFASGAAHIELGDGERMLSIEYFPADTRLAVSPGLHEQLRHYYDFLTAYEVYLRDQLTPAPVTVSIAGTATDPLGVPNTVWSIARQHGSMTVVHLINLLGSDDPHWRDISISHTDAPRLHDLRVQLTLVKQVRSIGWASPDVDGVRFHAITFQHCRQANGEQIEFLLPGLHYWDTLLMKTGNPNAPH